MATPKFIQSNYSDFFGSSMLPVLEEVFRANLQRHPSVRDQIFRKVKHDREIWQYSELHDMPLLSSVSEGSDYLFKRPLQGSDKTLTIVKQGLGFSISEEAVEDGKFNYIADAIAKMASSAMETKEQAGMDVLNNGFSSETVADGQPVFDAAHTTPTGSITFANEPSTSVDLSFTSLADALTEFDKNFRGDSGIYYKIRPKFLVVPSELKLYAKQLVASAGQADTADNNMNPFRDDLMVISSPNLTDSDAWFLISDPSMGGHQNGLVSVERKGIETKAAGGDAGFINDSILYKCRYRDAIGAVHAYGLYGSPGA